MTAQPRRLWLVVFLSQDWHDSLEPSALVSDAPCVESERFLFGAAEQIQ